MKNPHAESIVLQIAVSSLPEQAMRDLEANAQLNRQTPEQRLADLLTKKLGGAFIVTPATVQTAA